MSETETNSNELPGAFSLFQPSWEALRLNLVTFIELALIPVLIILVGSLLKHAAGVALTSIGEILAIVFSPAVYLTQLRSAQNKTIDFADALKESFHYFWRFMGLIICVGIIITIGFILLIVPGFFMIRRYMLSPYYLLDRDMNVFDAMKASAEDSKKFSGAIWGLIGVMAMLVIVIAILEAVVIWLYVIGLVVYYTYYCAPSIRYLQIKKASKAVKD